MKLINLKINDIRDALANGLGSKLAKEGYEFKKTNSWFVKSENDCEYYLYLMLTAWANHYAVEVKLYIKQKRVEKILKKIVGSTTGLTMGNSVAVIFNSPDGRQVVNNVMDILLVEDADIESSIETIAGFYDNIAKPYFEKYSSLTAMNDIFNNPPFKYCAAHIGGMFDERCMRGLIIARLVNNPDYEKLVAVYSEEIKSTMVENSITDFEKVQEYLMYNRIS